VGFFLTWERRKSVNNSLRSVQWIHEPTGGPVTEPRINDLIESAEVRLVGPDGEQIGIVTIERARQLARDSQLDLVEVAPLAGPPIAKLMSYQAYRQESDRKVQENRRKDIDAVIEELRGRAGP